MSLWEFLIHPVHLFCTLIPVEHTTPEPVTDLESFKKKTRDALGHDKIKTPHTPCIGTEDRSVSFKRLGGHVITKIFKAFGSMKVCVDIIRRYAHHEHVMMRVLGSINQGRLENAVFSSRPFHDRLACRDELPDIRYPFDIIQDEHDTIVDRVHLVHAINKLTHIPAFSDDMIEYTIGYWRIIIDVRRACDLMRALIVFRTVLTGYLNLFFQVRLPEPRNNYMNMHRVTVSSLPIVTRA